MSAGRGVGGGLAAWSVRHPVGVSMLALAVIVLGGFALGRLNVDLLPHIIYPEVRVRVVDPGVPPEVMEDQVTRQLEEQLAITEDAIAVQSTTTEGRSAVDLSFAYGTDIDRALRDASTRLDRAKRFLPDTIEPPTIYKRDPSQIPVLEFVVSSTLRDPVELRSWVDYTFAKWFLTLPGVAAAEVGGGLVREVQVLPDPRRLGALGLSLDDLVDALQAGNRETPGGRLEMARSELSGRTAGRLESLDALASLPIPLPGGETVHLAEVAEVVDTHQDERLRIRLNDIPGIKLSIQKQPSANTVAVADAVHARLQWLRAEDLIPADVTITPVGDEAVFVRTAVNNAALAAASGALLAMAVVYLFLGSVRRTLIIGSAIPIAIMVTFVLMVLGGLTLNVMTLGGLALGVGMLVDNTIVMLENIVRHQRAGESPEQAGTEAAAEVNGAIVASTTTNLAAVLPFLFIGGLVGLIFRELIFTISAAIVASLAVALTLVPALSARVPARSEGGLRRAMDGIMERLGRGYARTVGLALKLPWLPWLVFLAALWATAGTFLSGSQAFLPELDDGRIRISLTADPGTSLEEMDRAATRVEQLLLAEPEVETVFATVGGFVFGRSQFEASNRTSLQVQLVPRSRRALSSEAWIRRVKGEIDALRLPGLRVFLRTQGIRGISLGRGSDELSLRIQGPDLAVLERLAETAVERLARVPGLRNVQSSTESVRQEVAVVPDRERTAALGLDVAEVGKAVRRALEGEVVTDYLDGDRSFDVRLRLPRAQIGNPADLEEILLFPSGGDRPPVYLGDVARVTLVAAPAEIRRDNQQRIVEVTAAPDGGVTLGEAALRLQAAAAELELPPGYSAYEGGTLEALQAGRTTAGLLLGLALFLVFVVMAVQYESLRNPLVILLSVPFAAIGAALGLRFSGLPLSMPVWLGLIMLAGIVVNNAIVLVEYVEILRRRGLAVREALVEAARLRLRPILMTTLTTVMGMLPLALGVGEGSELLQPLAVTIVSGLSFSLLVSLLLVPATYRVFHPRG